MICKPIEWPQRKKPARELSQEEKDLKKAWFENFQPKILWKKL